MILFGSGMEPHPDHGFRLQGRYLPHVLGALQFAGGQFQVKITTATVHLYDLQKSLVDYFREYENKLLLPEWDLRVGCAYK